MMVVEIAGQDTLTHSCMTCAKTCLRKFNYAYRLGIRKSNVGAPLRMGTAFHYGVDLMAKGYTLEDAIAGVRANYSELPAWIMTADDEHDWQTECETVVVMLTLYKWRWANDCYEVIATELGFDLPLINPETGKPATSRRIAGKIDKIVRLPDQRIAIMEHKTTSDTIDSDSDYWKHLRLDTQISGYFLAARELGYDVATVIYDVAKKPGHSPCQIPTLDKDGFKITIDADGNRLYLDNGKPRQAASKEKGWELVTTRETPEQFAQRIYQEMYQQYDRYFQRQEIPRLESDLEEYRWELWQQHQQLRQCELNDRWYRNTAACLSPYKCDYFDVCTQGIDPLKNMPAGFVQVGHVHQELVGA